MNQREDVRGDTPAQDIVQAVKRICELSDLHSRLGRGISFDQLQWRPFAGDGSNRRFWRLIAAGRPFAVVIAPEHLDEPGLREARAAFHIGNHLYHRRVPVPQPLGYDQATGVLVCEYLGEVKLYDLVAAVDLSDQTAAAGLLALYRQVVQELVNMQLHGRDGFDRQWCCDTTRYTKTLMLEKESGYFLRSFWQDLMALPVPSGIEEDFQLLAESASASPADYFLYRDFQSRNIMVCDNTVRFIDYQGGRLGPLGYDLASLLIDPYVQLPQWFQDLLYEHYFATLAGQQSVQRTTFDRHYISLALQRNLQIIGAFSFLSTIRKKSFFGPFIYPALCSLKKLLADKDAPDLPTLAKMADRALAILPDLAQH